MAIGHAPMGAVARIVEVPGALELRSDQGTLLCSMVYGSGHPELQPTARVSLVREARERGYIHIDAARGAELVT